MGTTKAVVTTEVADSIKHKVAVAVTTYGPDGAVPASDLKTIHKAMRELAPRNPAEQVRGVAMIDRTFEQDIIDAQRAADSAAREVRRLEAHRRLFRDFIRDVMVAKGIPKLKTDLFNIAVVAGRETMSCPDVEKVADEFRKVKVTADIASAKQALKSDGVVPAGFEFHRGDPHIRITLK